MFEQHFLVPRGTVGVQRLAQHEDISMAERDRNKKVCFQRLSYV